LKLLRLKITDPEGFRSLPCDFEYHFRSEWTLQDELAKPTGFAPFVCAGPNGSGKCRVLKISASPSVFQRPGKNYAGANPSRSVSMTIRTVFPADGARVIERRGRRSKYHLFNNDFRNARAAMAPLNHDASKLPSRVRL
jgi:hypothetical protein